MLPRRRCVIVPDVHQDVAWVRRIFERERVMESDAQVVFLGDYFDSWKKPPAVAGVAETCRFLLETRAALRGRCVFLLGNHDIQYWEARVACASHRSLRHLHNKCGAAFSHNAAKKITKGLSVEFWLEARLFVVVDGWLLSHAGVAAEHWPTMDSPEDSLGLLEEKCKAALAMMRHGQQPLLAAGKSRGGDALKGGLTWLDWNEEFSDDLPLPQIVGHTADEAGARQKGRSWCIDGHQSCYAVLENGGCEVRNVIPMTGKPILEQESAAHVAS